MKKTQLPAKPSLQRKPAKRAVPLKEGTSKEIAKLQYGVCRKYFKYPKALQTHMAGNCEKPFQCSKCDTTFSSKKDLNQHIIGYHKDSNDNIHKCDHCESSFKSSGGLKRHEKNIHLETKYGCPDCDYQGSL